MSKSHVRANRKMKKFIITAVAAAALTAATFPAGAEASHQQVLCGNFGGQTMDPHLAREPARCDVTHPRNVDELRHMKWSRWGDLAVGHGLVNGREHRVRLKEPRPCGLNGQFKVYSRMSIDGRPFSSILYCGD
jgi:hypothetical protein